MSRSSLRPGSGAHSALSVSERNGGASHRGGHDLAVGEPELRHSSHLQLLPERSLAAKTTRRHRRCASFPPPEGKDAMNDTLDKGQFWNTFKARMVVVTDLPPGHSRDLACEVNEAVGRGDASLRTKAEYSALFEGLLREPDSVAAPDLVRLRQATGDLTPAGHVVEDYLAASKGKAEFFDQDMYMVHVTGWPPDSSTPEEPVASAGDARLDLWPTDPRDDRRLPPPDRQDIVLSTPTFSLMNSGNRTLRAPKRSWKINFDVKGINDRLV